MEITNGGIKINLETRKVTVNGESRHFTRKEFELLSLFMKNQGKALSYDDILRNWNGRKKPTSHINVRAFIKRVREKTGYGSITSVFGYGYRMNGEEE